MAITWKKLAYEDDVVLKSLFDATTFLYATVDNIPEAKTPADVMAILSGEASADFSMNTQKITDVVDPTSDQEAATKKYVDDQLGGVDEFTELTDTPADYAGAGARLVAVNDATSALEFVPFSDYLEANPTSGETEKAPNSDWAFDHDADVDAHHPQIHAAAHKNDQGDEILLNELGEPTGAVDINGQQLTDAVLHNSAGDPATPVVGKIYFKTGDTSPYVCTSAA